jgi:hypothetical protein
MIWSDENILSAKEYFKPGTFSSFEFIVGHTTNVSGEFKYEIEWIGTDIQKQNDGNSLQAKQLSDNNQISIPEGSKLKDGD